MRSPASSPTMRTTIAARSVNRIVDATRFAHIGSRPCPDKSTRESASAVRSSPRAAPRWNSGAFFMIPRRANHGPHPVASRSDSVLHEYWHAELNVAIDPADEVLADRSDDGESDQRA
jgi:hypothetical protein